MEQNKAITWSGVISLLIIYLVWGSTYLAIRIAVREGSGFPPFMLGATRVTLAGLVLILWGAFRKVRVKPTRQELITLLISGLFLWVGGNGLVAWAEQRVDSGLAALIIAAIPIWTAVVTSIMDREFPSLRMVLALLMGFLGMVVLSIPVLQSGVRGDVYSIIGLLGAGLAWATGSVLQSRRPVHLNDVASAGYQQFFGGLGLLIVSILLDEPAPQPVMEAWLAWGYLFVFGSILAFTAFVRALRLLPTKIVMTYPYVNPIIAVFLGWLILSEPVSGWTFGGAALILLGVAGVFRERYRLE